MQSLGRVKNKVCFFMSNQVTIKSEVTLEGKGLHLGKPSKVVLKPAAEYTGIQFSVGEKVLPVNLENITQRPLRTALETEGVSVETIEHLLSAIHGMGVTNLDVVMEGVEPPACDGSANEFCSAIDRAGYEEQSAEALTYSISEPLLVSVPNNGGEIIGLPYADGLKITYVLSGKGLPDQVVEYEHSRENYLEKVSRARTFCRQFEVEQLTQMEGVGDGASEENTLVVNLETLDEDQRFKNELTYHKILDLIGDLALFGKSLKGHLICYHSGHACNHELLRALRRQSGEHSINIYDIKKILPHAYPFLLVDRIIDYEENKRVVGLKNVTINEPFFEGHFPGEPIMPGVLLIEALAQTGAACLHRDFQEESDRLVLFTGADKVKFRHRVIPGDQVILDIQVKHLRSQMGVVRGVAKVGSAVACEAELKFMIVERGVS
jgi:UDP-3-O-[3-hydroxymyristoyl] N-acetylglucosamine deacetylase / 3-hydroxyacyl-[acyl-carrier-protein] dehydratase